jgi:hypothetical protein
MTQTESDQLKRLFKLANISQELEFVDFKTVDHFNTLREQYGLSKLLMLIQEYAVQLCSKSETYPPEIINPTQNPNVVQRV